MSDVGATAADTQRVIETKADDLRSVLRALESELEVVVEARAETREQLRSTERSIQRLESNITALRDLLDSAGADPRSAQVTSIQSGPVTPGIVSSLVGLPRVQAIEIVLAEATEDIHRNEICQQLRSRGFPAEQLGDTSAALAYLKRRGRAVNTARGYWRGREAS